MLDAVSQTGVSPLQVSAHAGEPAAPASPAPPFALAPAIPLPAEPPNDIPPCSLPPSEPPVLPATPASPAVPGLQSRCSSVHVASVHAEAISALRTANAEEMMTVFRVSMASSLKSFR